MKLYTDTEFMKNNANKSSRELANELGVSSTVISKWRRKLKIEKESVQEMYMKYDFMKDNMHKSNRELAKELGCAHSTIKEWRKKLKLNNPRNTDKNGVSTFKNKEWLKKAYENIGTNMQIAEICGVSDDTIEYWRNKFGIEKSDKWRDVNRKYSVDHNYFKMIDTEDKAYWLGFIMADGCVSRTEPSDPYNRFEINLKKSDHKHLEKLKASLSSNYPIKILKNFNKKRNFWFTVANLRISSSIMVADLINNGIVPNKTGKETIPKTVPKDLMRHFLRGFLDGDGTITAKATAGFCSSSKIIIEEIKEFIEKELNIMCNMRKSNDDVAIYTITYSKKKAKILLDYLYEDSSTYLDRKYERYKSLHCSPIQ